MSWWLYTPGTNAYHGGAALTRINHPITVANQIPADSEVGITLRLVRTEQVGYSETANTSTALAAIRTGSDPSLSQIAGLRSSVGADLVIFMRPSTGDGYGGMAYLGGPGTQGDLFLSTDWMYSHVSINASDYVTAHELGHNMGLLHSRVQDPQGGTYSFSVGHGV